MFSPPIPCYNAGYTEVFFVKRLICVLFLPLLLLGCARQETADPATIPTTAPVQTEAAVPETEPGGEMDFADLKYIEFHFNSGAGAWGTVMRIDSDGSFSGNYRDSEMGDVGEDYPMGSVYVSEFTGRFSQPEEVNGHTFSLNIEELQYAQEPGTQEIREGIRYCYSTAHGLDAAEQLLLYLPGAPLEELPEEYRYWCSATLYDYEGTELPHYGLYNAGQAHGFYAVDILEDARKSVRNAEEYCAGLDVWLETNLTQADMNTASQEKYVIWDNALNDLWTVLRNVLPKEEMDQLTQEELAWIREKEAAVDAAGAEVEGGSIYPTVINTTAAQLTRERVYELLEYLPEQG